MYTLNYILLGAKVSNYDKSKVLSEKKETKVDAHISVNFSHFFANFVLPKMVIFIAFQRGATHYCDFIM